MSTPDLSAFNFSFDPTLDTWAVSNEPAELDSSEIFLPNVEGRTEFLPPDPDRVPVIENSVRTDDPTYAARPAEERTRELLSQMRPHRATLLGILAACETPMATSAMKETVERISGRKFSVYTPSNFCTMLEVAGGLARVTDAGEPYTDEVRAPEMVEVDGRAFWRPTTPPPVYWQTTEAGATVLAEDDPAARIERLFAKEPEFLPVYKRILLMADTEEGTSMGLMSVAVDTDPAIAENRRFYVQHFVESLERAGAFVWADGAWRATDAGRAALAGALVGFLWYNSFPAQIFSSTTPGSRIMRSSTPSHPNAGTGCLPSTSTARFTASAQPFPICCGSSPAVSSTSAPCGGRSARRARRRIRRRRARSSL